MGRKGGERGASAPGESNILPPLPLLGRKTRWNFKCCIWHAWARAGEGRNDEEEEEGKKKYGRRRKKCIPRFQRYSRIEKLLRRTQPRANSSTALFTARHEGNYLMSQWSFGRSAFAAHAAADAARHENTKPLQRPSET